MLHGSLPHIIIFYHLLPSTIRTKARILERGVDMRGRVKIVLHFVAIMKVQSSTHTCTHHKIKSGINH